MLDLVIRNGILVDGTGAPRRPADVAVKDGRVVSIGAVKESAATTIDADGAIVAPGFIDVHTHFDAQVFWDPALTPSCTHGFTTVVAGNCGFSIAPLTDEAAPYLMSMLSRVEGMPLASLQSGVPWNWATTEEYLQRLTGRIGLNMGFMVGHSTIRRVIMGPAAKERAATPDEIEAMKTVLRQGLAAGGMGFSTSVAQSHIDANGDPVPSRCAAYDELVELAAVCGEFPGTSLEMVPQVGDLLPDEHVTLMIDMSKRAGRPLNWNAMRATSRNSAELAAKLGITDRASATGAKVVGLLMPMPAEIWLNFLTGAVLDMLPGWNKPMTLTPAEKTQLLRNPTLRAELRDQATHTPRPSRYSQWADYVIYEPVSPHLQRYTSRAVADIGREEGKEPFDVLVDIALEDNLRTSFGVPQLPDSRADWEARVEALRDPRAVVGASDAGAHLDMNSGFGYTTYLLEQAVRVHGLMSTEEVVHLITQAPADLYGIRDRGTLRKGLWADIVVFDEDSVGRGPVRTRSDLPAGAMRLYSESTGIQQVIVNGEVLVEHGNVTEGRPGRVLLSGRDTSTPTMKLPAATRLDTALAVGDANPPPVTAAALLRFHKEREMHHEELIYWSEGLQCAAELFVPDDIDQPRAGLVLGHGFAQTKDALRAEATLLCEGGGYPVLTIDYRRIGKSDGTPRGQVNPRDQVEDFRHAITFLSRRPEVDERRIGIWGVSLGGGLALQVAAIDRRVRAVVAQSPIVNGRRWIRDTRGSKQFEELLIWLQEDFVARYGGGDSKRVRYNPSGPPSGLVDDETNPNIVAFDTKYQPTLEPMIPISSIEKIIDFQADAMIDMIAPRPMLIVANGGYDAANLWQCDTGHLLDHIQDAFRRAGEPKHIVVLPYDAFGLYNEPGRSDAIRPALEFYNRYLPAESET